MLGLPLGMAGFARERIHRGAAPGDSLVRMAIVRPCGHSESANLVPAGRHIPFQGVEQLQMVMAAAGLPLQLTQLAGGQLRGDLLALAVGPLLLRRVRLDRPLHVRGAKDPQRQLICLDLNPPGQTGPRRSHGQPLAATAVCGLAAEGDVHLSLPAGACVGLLMIDRQAFERWCLLLGCEGLDQQALERNWLILEPRRFENLRRALVRLFAMGGGPTAELARLAIDDLMPLLLEALVHAGDRAGSLLRPPARIEVVKTAQRWMELHPHQPLSLNDLCRTVHVSRRSLIRGFRDHLGMGPMTYHRLQRLHAVRHALLQSDPRAATVIDVASRHGFLNHGHFAGAYRRLFDEAPSATLQQAPGQSGGWCPPPP